MNFLKGISDKKLAKSEATLMQFSGLQPHEYSLTNIPISKGNIIHTLTCGQGTVPLVMVHGYGGSCMFFYKIYKDLAQYFKIYAIDLLGYGSSSRPKFKAKSVDDAEQFFIEAIEEWRQAMKLEHFVLAGHSFGGYVLVPNLTGLDTALKNGVKEIAVFAAASEAFSKKNINCTIDESFKRFEDVINKAKEEKLKIRGYVSCVLGCPYEGEIDPAKVNYVAKKLYESGCYEISLGDTIGIGTPEKTKKLFDTIELPKSVLASHFHNTYDRAIQNLIIALSEGVAVIDSSVAGLGGCPYAKGATGNVATEDVVFLLELLGIEHGVNIEELISTGNWISGKIGGGKRSNVTQKDFDMLI